MSDFGSWPCSNCVSLEDAKASKNNWTEHIVVDTELGGTTRIRCLACGWEREAVIYWLPEDARGESALDILAACPPPESSRAG